MKSTQREIVLTPGNQWQIYYLQVFVMLLVIGFDLNTVGGGCVVGRVMEFQLHQLGRLYNRIVLLIVQ